MKIFKKLIYRITHVGLFVNIALVLSAGMLAILAILFKWGLFPIILVSLYSAYVIVATLLSLTSDIEAVIRIINKNAFATKYVFDYEYRMNILLNFGFIINFAYAALNGIFGLFNLSLWFVSIFVFYAIFGFLKMSLIKEQRLIESITNETLRDIRGLKTRRFVAFFLLIITVPLAIMVLLMVKENRNYYYGSFITFCFGICTIIYVIAAVVKMILSKKRDNHIFTAFSIISLCGALMSILSFQTAIISEFDIELHTRQICNAITGAFVISAFIYIALYSIISSTIRINKFKIHSK
ncbi:MAG: hypothetical protein J6B60_05375 [Clostridia bacterium]|nr:hypothetical protein [Clostridia bacterium]